MTSEIWADIENYYGLYQVSNLGRVRSLDRVVKRKNHYNLTLKGKIKPLHEDNKGYHRVQLSKKGKLKTHKVHRLVMNRFVHNPENKPQVNHIDGDKKNNIVDNLEWVTNSENQIHARDMRAKKKLGTF